MSSLSERKCKISESPISALLIPNSLIGELQDLGINTIGDLQSYGTRWLLDNSAINSVSFVKIEQAIEIIYNDSRPQVADPIEKVEILSIFDKENIALLRPVEDLQLSVRAMNVLQPNKNEMSLRRKSNFDEIPVEYVSQHENINLIGELVQVTRAALLRKAKCGTKTVIEIQNALVRFNFKLGTKIDNWNQQTVSELLQDNMRRISILKEQEAASKFKRIFKRHRNNVEDELGALIKFFGFKSARNEKIWCQFWGWDGKGKKTLERVGQIHGVTRERVRQLIAKQETKTRLLKWPATKNLVAAFDYISRHTLHTKAEVEKGLVSKGITKNNFDITAFIGMAELLDKKIDWNIDKINGKEFVITQKELKVTKSVISLTKRLVSRFGYTTLEVLSTQVLEHKIGQINNDKIRKILTRFEFPIWLDEQKNTLFVRTSRNRILNLITKMVSACGPLNVVKIKEGLRRNTRVFRVPSTNVLLSFCRAHDIFHVNDRLVCIDQNKIPEGIIVGNELEFLSIFNTHGPIQAYEEIRKHCLEQGMNEHTFEVYLTSSSLIDRLAPGIYALRGTEVDPFKIDNLKKKFHVHVPSIDDGNVGWTVGGKLWAVRTVTPNILRTGIAPLPKAVNKHLNGEYSLCTLNGERFGKLTHGGNSIWSIKKALRAKGVEYNDNFILVFDLTERTVIIEVGDSEIFDRAKEGKLLQFNEEHDDVAFENSLNL